MSTDNFFVELSGKSIDSDEVESNCFRHFATASEQGLNLKDFGELAKSLFCESDGKPYGVLPRMLADMFYVFDKNKDGKIDREEFKTVWKDWIEVVLKPVSALIVIDVQNDFITGTLSIKNCPAKQNGEDVVPIINELIDKVSFNTIIYSLDWHPDDHISFIENVKERKIDESSGVTADEVGVYDTVIFEGPPKTEQKLWPKHCLQNSWGAEIHRDLTVVKDAIFVYKGTYSNIDSYSAFWDNQKLSATDLEDVLRNKGVTDVYCCGLAYDFCVGSTALHALELGYRTLLVDDASRGVDEKTISVMKGKIASLNGVIVTSDKVKALVQGSDRRPELGYRTAMKLAAKQK